MANFIVDGPLTIEKCQTVLGGKSLKKIGHNTWLEWLGGGVYGVRYHQTYVVKIHPDNTYTLNSGGWHTVTTRDRINEFAPARCYIEQKTMRIRANVIASEGCPVSHIQPVDMPFRDGIRLPAGSPPTWEDKVTKS